MATGVVAVFSDNLPPNTAPAEVESLMAPRLVELCFQAAALWHEKVKGAMGFPLGFSRVTAYRQETKPTGRLFCVCQTVDDGETFDCRRGRRGRQCLRGAGRLRDGQPTGLVVPGFVVATSVVSRHRTESYLAYLLSTMIDWLLQYAAEQPDLARGVPLPGIFSPAELQRLDEFRFEKRRREWLLGRWTAKQLLHSHLSDQYGFDAPLDALIVGREPGGAPVAILESQQALDALAGRRGGGSCR